MQSRTKIEARSHHDQSTYVLFKQQLLFEKDQETYKKGLLADDVMSHWGDLMILSHFVKEYCVDEDSELLEIHINVKVYLFEVCTPAGEMFLTEKYSAWFLSTTVRDAGAT